MKKKTKRRLIYGALILIGAGLSVTLLKRVNTLEKENEALKGENNSLKGQIRENEREASRKDRQIGNLNYQLGKKASIEQEQQNK